MPRVPSPAALRARVRDPKRFAERSAAVGKEVLDVVRPHLVEGEGDGEHQVATAYGALATACAAFIACKAANVPNELWVDALVDCARELAEEAAGRLAAHGRGGGRRH